MKKLRLALITGGTSNEREVALAGAKAVEMTLDPERYLVKRYDAATDLTALAAEKDQIDFAFLVIHGKNGEDGRLQGFLDLLGIPYQGSGVLGSALACDKLVAKELFSRNGILTPPWMTFTRHTKNLTQSLLAGLNLPMVIKPGNGGSSLGMSIVFKEEEVEEACRKCLDCSDSGLAEAYIQGRELTCAVLGDNPVEALPVIEIRPGKDFSFFDYTAKYTPGATEEICPAPIPENIRDQVQQMAVQAHEILRLANYSRSDFIFSEDKIYILETNTLPGMTKTSLLPLAAKTAGMSFGELIDRLVRLGMEK